MTSILEDILYMAEGYDKATKRTIDQMKQTNQYKRAVKANGQFKTDLAYARGVAYAQSANGNSIKDFKKHDYMLKRIRSSEKDEKERLAS